jgi:hypothetical protein
VKEEVCRSQAYGERVIDPGSLSKSMSFRRKKHGHPRGYSEEKHDIHEKIVYRSWTCEEKLLKIKDLKLRSTTG